MMIFAIFIPLKGYCRHLSSRQARAWTATSGWAGQLEPGPGTAASWLELSTSVRAESRFPCSDKGAGQTAVGNHLPEWDFKDSLRWGLEQQRGDSLRAFIQCTFHLRTFLWPRSMSREGCRLLNRFYHFCIQRQSLNKRWRSHSGRFAKTSFLNRHFLQQRIREWRTTEEADRKEAEKIVITDKSRFGRSVEIRRRTNLRPYRLRRYVQMYVPNYVQKGKNLWFCMYLQVASTCIFKCSASSWCIHCP